jgi:hypothetical protein
MARRYELLSSAKSGGAGIRRTVADLVAAAG